jgi:hypothetical protein
MQNVNFTNNRTIIYKIYHHCSHYISYILYIIITVVHMHIVNRRLVTSSRTLLPPSSAAGMFCCGGTMIIIPSCFLRCHCHRCWSSMTYLACCCYRKSGRLWALSKNNNDPVYVYRLPSSSAVAVVELNGGDQQCSTDAGLGAIRAHVNLAQQRFPLFTWTERRCSPAPAAEEPHHKRRWR